MKNSFHSAIKDTFVKDLLRFAAIVAAAIVAVIGFKTLRNYFKKK